MRTARKLLLPALVVLAGFTASPSASAQISVATEPTEAAACPPVTLESHHAVRGGCRVHFVGEQETQIIVETTSGPVVLSTCEDELEALIDSSGEGYAYAADMTGHATGPTCTRTACDEAAPSHVPMPWPVHIRANPGGGQSLHMTLCLRQTISDEGTAGVSCQLAIPMTQTSNPHRQSLNAEGGVQCSNLTPVTFVGHWHTETGSAGHPEVEVVRRPDPDPPVTVADEATEDPCPAVTLGAGHTVSGGCRIHLVSEGETQIVVGTPTGPVLVSTCEDEFEGAIDSGGEGYLYDINLTNHPIGDPCTRTACDEAAPSHATIPWPIHLREDSSGVERLHMLFCLRIATTSEGNTGFSCELNVPMIQTTNPHQQDFNFEAGTSCPNLPPGALMFFGHWHTEAGSPTHPEVYVSH